MNNSLLHLNTLISRQSSTTPEVVGPLLTVHYILGKVFTFAADQLLKATITVFLLHDAVLVYSIVNRTH